MLPVRYATLSEVTSNLSRRNGFAMMPRSMVSTRDVRDTVVGVGCRKPYNNNLNLITLNLATIGNLTFVGFLRLFT